MTVTTEDPCTGTGPQIAQQALRPDFPLLTVTPAGWPGHTSTRKAALSLRSQAKPGPQPTCGAHYAVCRDTG